MHNILVIDDDAAIRTFLRRFLEKEGFHVSEAEDGEAALRRLDNGPADLVIVDIFMPRKDGFETIREIKGRKSPCKILAISGGGSIGRLDYLDLAKIFGANAVLAKPISRDALITTVSTLAMA
ncbi:CheY-like receiver, AAA-type ATPase, and DNA-binding domain containing response regulator [Desulfocurvibacter africanus PCS]|uniref:CheY-like receiver, AAA-type ATPase, and DNA-binding domain containing response regulator n=1 Tax=Desulfocurvibacter africanus PCS TaxID=1262666 RepID=M5PPH0_DESAF|nr:response regulator [Desulfocurvibacter africanus]EMG35884.1 CheY-like receiver, AAA-type ATPase, and DNA-binding domain containing response regulator [Desulfocurvibacter africanus PCS]